MMRVIVVILYTLITISDDNSNSILYTLISISDVILYTLITISDDNSNSSDIVYTNYN